MPPCWLRMPACRLLLPVPSWPAQHKHAHFEGVADDEVAMRVKLCPQRSARAQVGDGFRVEHHHPALLPGLLDCPVAVKHDKPAIWRHCHRLCSKATPAYNRRCIQTEVTLTVCPGLMEACNLFIRWAW
eukprot:GHRQ01024783.1.p2 GENE.GHRQ01024783.1~~GHRQ01024783.1.p2  ORF type:complete len:129 (+),score=10.59 GHRQ01024783.1:64-450(+)